MKRTAILTITAFYLLLTTGMFVCAVHCAAESLITKRDMHEAKSAGHHGKDNAEKKDCDCCKKHPNYIVKENIKPATDIQHVQTAVSIRHFQIAGWPLNVPTSQNTSWKKSKAPPGMSGKAISIQNCSLLI